MASFGAGFRGRHAAGESSSGIDVEGPVGAQETATLTEADDDEGAATCLPLSLLEAHAKKLNAGKMQRMQWIAGLRKRSDNAWRAEFVSQVFMLGQFPDYSE